MVTENKVNFIVNLDGNVSQKAKTYGSDIAAMSDSGSRSMRGLSASTDLATKSFSFLSSRLLAFAGVGAAFGALKNLDEYRQQFVKLANQFNLTEEQAESLKKTLWKISASNALEFDDLFKPVLIMLNRTNDYDAVKDNIDNIALAINGLGFSAEEAGDKIGILMTKKWSSSDITQFLNDTANFSKMGTGNLREQFNRVVDVANSTSWNTPKQLRQLMAIERLGAAEVGDSGVSAAALQEFYGALQDLKKRIILRKNGVEPLDESKKKLRDPMELFLEMGDKSKYANDNISTIVGGNFSILMQSFKDKARQETLKNSVGSYDNDLLKKNAESGSFSMGGIWNTVMGYAGLAFEHATDGNTPGAAKVLMEKRAAERKVIEQNQITSSNYGLSSTLKQAKDRSLQSNENQQNKVSGNINLHVTSDKGLTVKPIDVKSTGVDVTVDTGSTSGGLY